MTAAGARREVVRMRSLRPVDVAMFAFYLVLLVLALVADLRQPVWLVALVPSVACAVLWFVARCQLGTAFSVRPAAHGLVTTGLYAWVRHPIYLFGTAAFLLVLLALQGWGALVVWAILVPVQVVRARREERVLATTYGAQYTAYRQRTAHPTPPLTRVRGAAAEGRRSRRRRVEGP